MVLGGFPLALPLAETAFAGMQPQGSSTGRWDAPRPSRVPAGSRGSGSALKAVQRGTLRWVVALRLLALKDVPFAPWVMARYVVCRHNPGCPQRLAALAARPLVCRGDLLWVG